MRNYYMNHPLIFSLSVEKCINYKFQEVSRTVKEHAGRDRGKLYSVK